VCPCVVQSSAVRLGHSASTRAEQQGNPGDGGWHDSGGGHRRQPFDTPPPYIPVDEEYPARPESSYSLAKHLEEQMAAQFCRWDPQLTAIGLRFSNVMEPDDYARFSSFQDDPALRRWNLWGYIDARDGAQAARLALSYPEPGLQVFVIANADTVMERTSAELAAAEFPGVPVTRELGPHETMLSIDKARRLLGYEPRHSWRTPVP